MRYATRTIPSIALLAASAACQTTMPAAMQQSRTAAQATASTALPSPSLIVLVTVDQLRGDYIDRFAPQLQGGLARLARGAWFTNAHHDHALTETAPGHATLLSGRFPRSTGIMANWAGVEDSSASLLGGSEMVGIGASPRRFRGTTLVDWLKARYPASRALSVSMKDRGAILPIGRSRSDVYWYVTDGRFTTSRYYRDSLPGWVSAFNARRLPQGMAGKAWPLLLAPGAYSEPDSVPIERGGVNFLFPHSFPNDTVRTTIEVRVSPWMDEITLDLALAGVNALSLGKGPGTDVLAVSLSATDLVGHAYGPDSREMHDNVLRLDRNLGAFFDSLFRMRDSSRIAIVLTGDHGMSTIPELVPKSVQPTPVRVNLPALAAGLAGIVAASGIDTSLIELDQHMVLVDPTLAANRRAGVDSILDIFAAQVRALPGVARVDRMRDLLRGDTINDPIVRRWVHQVPAVSNVELVITLAPFSIFSGIVATHGSPYDSDSWVPIIFSGPWFAPGRYNERVRTVDLAPTLAEVAGVKPAEKIDGVVLRRALK